MPQQINLCSTAFQKPRQQFSADTIAIALCVFVVLGGALCAAFVWNLQSASQGFVAAMQTQTQEMQSLQVAIDRSKAMAQPPSPALIKEVRDKRTEVDSKELILQALQQGNWKPGYGHSDRLSLLARSIPAPVWITDVKADSARMEVSGFTLEPSALNDWVGSLSASPLMQGLRLATVKVQSTAVSASTAAVAGTAPAASGREVWSFNLVSAQPAPSEAPAVGGKP
jgi:Tfp pilus assembly protein PilN